MTDALPDCEPLPARLGRVAPARAYPRLVPDRESFPHGWRWQDVTMPGGETDLVQVPLGPDDYLNPSEGDEMPEGDPHALTVTPVFDMLRRHLQKTPGVAVFFDLIMRWGIPGLKNPAPDVSVVFGLEDRSRIEGSFDVLREKTRPSLVIEVVSQISESRKKKDYTKLVTVYEQAGVDEYLIMEPLKPSRPDLVKLTLHRRNKYGHYQEIGPDAHGRIFSETTNLFFIAEEGQKFPGVAIIDAHTQTRLLTSDEEEAQRVAQTKRAEAEAAARIALEEELARIKEELAHAQATG